MILNVTIERVDPIEMHQQWEKKYIDSKGGMEPIEFDGMKFRFHKDFEVEQEHKSQQYCTGRTTRFKLLLVHGI